MLACKAKELETKEKKLAEGNTRTCTHTDTHAHTPKPPILLWLLGDIHAL